MAPTKEPRWQKKTTTNKQTKPLELQIGPVAQLQIGPVAELQIGLVAELQTGPVAEPQIGPVTDNQAHQYHQASRLRTVLEQ